VLPTVVTKNVIAPSNQRNKSKIRISWFDLAHHDLDPFDLAQGHGEGNRTMSGSRMGRNPKQTPRQINLKSGKSKTPNPKEACLEFYTFWSFEIVSNFGFRASNVLFLAPLRETLFFRSLFLPEISNMIG
jgi:hypothetical protein